MEFLLIASYPDSIINFRGPLISKLQSLGLSVHVAAPDFPDGSNERVYLESLGFTVHEIPLQRTGTNPRADFRTLVHLYRLMRNIRPDFVLSYTIKPVIYGTIAAVLARVPQRFVLITGLGYVFQRQAKGMVERLRDVLLQIVVQRLYGLALCSVKNVLFQNPDDEALFRKLGILMPKAQSAVINGSGVDITKYSVAPLPDLSPENPISFLLIARLLRNKGICEYVAAARCIKIRFPHIVFRLVGWLDENPESIGQNELDSWIDDGTIEFLGRLIDVRPVIARSSVYVLPSYREGTPRTVLEAMAMGRPIITTDVPGCRETVICGDNGFLVPKNDVQALVESMERFINTPSLISQMGFRSRQIAESKYNVHLVNEAMLREMDILD